jgi:hypothetical protein
VDGIDVACWTKWNQDLDHFVAFLEVLAFPGRFTSDSIPQLLLSVLYPTCDWNRCPFMQI